MPDYAAMLRPELHKHLRDRDLSGAGTNPELIARLEAADAEAAKAADPDHDPLGLDDEEPTHTEIDANGQPTTEDPPAPASGPPADEPDEVVTNTAIGRMGTVFRWEFPADDEVTDDRHFRFIEITQEQARRAGHEPKGGTAIGRRVGYRLDMDGHRIATYEVPLRKSP